MLRDPAIRCTNLAKRIRSVDEFADPNTIKVVVDGNGDALYFSREPIPTRRMAAFEDLVALKQVCVIPFRRQTLLDYARLEMTPLERAESIDMLRFLEHGFKVRMVETELDSHAVDTPADLALVESQMRDDPVLSQYMAVI